jgi:hypothetical protein
MVEAGGVETNSGTENAQLIDFSRRTKRQKLEKRGQVERIWNTASGCQNESLVDLPYLCFVPDWRAVARVLIKRLPNQGLDYGLAANV